MIEKATGQSVLLAALMVLLSCGDPLVDAQYRGDPIFVVQGRIESFTAPAGIRFEEYEVLASLFWVTDFDTPGALVEQPSVSAEVSFPATFELKVFEAPKSEHFVRLDTGAEVAFGALLVYVDVDENGIYSDGDRLIGGSGRTGLLYSTEEIPLERDLADVYIPAGFSVRRLDFLCGNPLEDASTDSAHDVEFEFSGRPCDLDLSCPEDLRCLPIRRVCTLIEGPTAQRCTADAPCATERQVCHPDERICIARDPLVDQICRTTDECGPGQACLDYYGCVTPIRPAATIGRCERDLECEALGLVCDPGFGICVPKEALEIHVPGVFEPALLTCDPRR